MTAVMAMESGEEPPIAELILADARAIYWPKTMTGRDHQRAVLLAAVASEITVKERLLAQADAKTAPLVEVITSNPREVTQSVPQLLHKPYRAVTGRSLSDEKKELWRAVERLFKIRNDVAHRGHMPSEDQGRDAVDAATGLFAWLDSLELRASRD